MAASKSTMAWAAWQVFMRCIMARLLLLSHTVHYVIIDTALDTTVWMDCVPMRCGLDAGQRHVHGVYQRLWECLVACLVLRGVA